MTRQELRNRTPEFRCVDISRPWPKPRRTITLGTVFKALGILVLLVLLWETLPSRLFPECPRDTDVSRHCVD